MKHLGHLFIAILCWTVTVNQPVEKMVDGDTFDVTLSPWVAFSNKPIEFSERIRLLDIDTPERLKANWVQYLAATAFSQTWLNKGPFQLETCGRDVFGRILAVVYRGDSILADELRKAGHAKK